jgi:hypothetical protein
MCLQGNCVRDYSYVWVVPGVSQPALYCLFRGHPVQVLLFRLIPSVDSFITFRYYVSIDASLNRYTRARTPTPRLGGRRLP